MRLRFTWILKYNMTHMWAFSPLLKPRMVEKHWLLFAIWKATTSLNKYQRSWKYTWLWVLLRVFLYGFLRFGCSKVMLQLVARAPTVASLICRIATGSAVAEYNPHQKKINGYSHDLSSEHRTLHAQPSFESLVYSHDLSWYSKKIVIS